MTSCWRFRRLPRGAYVFADLERLDADQTRRVSARIKALRKACPDCRMLNLPDRIGSRLDIMRRLAEAGINDFRMLPLTTPPETFRYPVFLRRLDDHEGPVSGLLDTPAALQAAIDALDPADRQAGRLAITEYVDARNEQGLHEKRSCTRVGDQMFLSALDFSRGWVCKGEYDDPDTVLAPEREWQALVRAYADEPALRAAFDAAHIQYGRADYAVVNGRPQIFEINTNPWLEPPERVPGPARAGAEHIVASWLDAVGQVAGPASATIDWVEVAQASGRASGRSGRRLSRRTLARSVLRRLNQLHNETGAMRWLRRFRLV